MGSGERARVGIHRAGREGVVMDRFERLATFEDLDREEPGRDLGSHFAERREYGQYDESGGQLGRQDFEDARAAS